MKRIILIALLLLPTIASAAPSVKFTVETHDFGKVGEGEQLEYTFEFVNAGADDLLIEKLTTS